MYEVEAGAEIFKKRNMIVAFATAVFGFLPLLPLLLFVKGVALLYSLLMVVEVTLLVAFLPIKQRAPRVFVIVGSQVLLGIFLYFIDYSGHAFPIVACGGSLFTVLLEVAKFGFSLVEARNAKNL